MSSNTIGKIISRSKHGKHGNGKKPSAERLYGVPRKKEESQSSSSESVRKSAISVAVLWDSFIRC
jgi:hypothetical protein